MIKSAFLYIILLSICLSACSKEGTKEFFFGSGEGPDPFVIGSTLSPLQTNFNTDKGILPKPQPVRPPSQMPSRAKKASEILDIAVNTSQEEIAIIAPMSLVSKEITGVSTEVTGSVKKESAKVIDFYEFDQQMKEAYKKQESSGYLLSDVLGNENTTDPTISSEILDIN